MNKYLSIALWIVLGSVAHSVLADRACPSAEGLVESEILDQACSHESENFMETCFELIDDLTKKTTRTPQERFDLAMAKHRVADALRGESLYVEGEGMEAMGTADLYALHEAFPEDVEILNWLAALEVGSEKEIQLLRRIMSLAPDCSKNTKYLIEALDRKIYFLPETSEQHAKLHDERLRLMKWGYVHAKEAVWKLDFGGMEFWEYVRRGEKDTALKTRERIAHDTHLYRLSFDDESRSSSLRLLCDMRAYVLKFADLCLEAIEQVIERDLDSDRIVGDDVLEAASDLGYILVYTGYFGSKLEQPANITPLWAGDAARFAVWLRDALETIPSSQLTEKYYWAINNLIGKERKIELLREVLRQIPRSSDQYGELEAELLSIKRWPRIKGRSYYTD